MKTIICPCGTKIETEELMDAECGNCTRRAVGCNATQVTEWMTAEEIQKSNDDFAEHLYTAENNEFYGRGNW